VKAVIDLAHGLGLTATAEGVEDVPTLDLLRELGCDEAQGFFIARPTKGEELVEWVLRSGRSPATDKGIPRPSGLISGPPRTTGASASE
jgi:EAL domain-containing protein (putative c-di-GMP-specific phosphodiesterase class I)